MLYHENKSKTAKNVRKLQKEAVELYELYFSIVVQNKVMYKVNVGQILMLNNKSMLTWVFNIQK